jgi:hypothetical protein
MGPRMVRRDGFLNDHRRDIHDHVGQLGLDMYDAAEKKLVWRGTVSKTLDPKAKPESNRRTSPRPSRSSSRTIPRNPKSKAYACNAARSTTSTILLPGCIQIVVSNKERRCYGKDDSDGLFVISVRSGCTRKARAG